MSVMKLDRGDVVDTSDMKMVIIQLPTARPREAGDMPDELVRIIGRLVMGLPVNRAQMEPWGLSAMRIMEVEDIPFAELQARFGAELVEERSNVVPLRRSTLDRIAADAREDYVTDSRPDSDRRET